MTASFKNHPRQKNSRSEADHTSVDPAVNLEQQKPHESRVAWLTISKGAAVLELAPSLAGICHCRGTRLPGLCSSFDTLRACLEN